jgi:hypothetical protein
MLEGEVTFHVGGENFRGAAGVFVSFPRGIPHTFTIESTSARFLVMNTPGGSSTCSSSVPRHPTMRCGPCRRTAWRWLSPLRGTRVSHKRRIPAGALPVERPCVRTSTNETETSQPLPHSGRVRQNGARQPCRYRASRVPRALSITLKLQTPA